MANEIALFIDLENISTSMWKNFQQAPDPFKWIEKVRKYGSLVFGRAYGDFSQPHIARLSSDLRAVGIDQFDCPTKQRGDKSQSTVDSNIIIDLFEVALDRPSIKTFVLMAGDSDYIRVVARLRHRLDKEVVIAGVPGSISRELVRAAGQEDPLEPASVEGIDDFALVRLIDTYETTLRPGIEPTFSRLLPFVSDPRNSGVVEAQVAQGKLNEFVQRGILEQFPMELADGRPLRVTRLNRQNPIVSEALASQA